jgi:hypothetical protein
MIPTNVSSLSLLPVTKVDKGTIRLSLTDHDLQLFAITILWADGSCVLSLFVSVVRGTDWVMWV